MGGEVYVECLHVRTSSVNVQSVKACKQKFISKAQIYFLIRCLATPTLQRRLASLRADECQSTQSFFKL